MTEWEFEQKIEAAVDRLEDRIEGTADRLDRAISHAYRTSRPFRIASRGISLAAELGLLFAAGELESRGHRTAALWCFGLGASSMVLSGAAALLFRRR